MHVTLHVKYLLFLLDLNEKYSNVQFHENPSSVSRVVPCGRSDRHDEADSRLLQFCESALKERKKKKEGEKRRATFSSTFKFFARA
jgi:hypothetical protein